MTHLPKDVLDEHYLGLCALVTFGYQFTFFIITYVFRFDKVTDFAGGTNFFLLAALTFFLQGQYTTRQSLMTAFVCVWALRLAVFLFSRIIQWGEDKRFDEIRNSLPKLIVFWVFQMVWVFTVSLPVIFVNSNDNDNLKDFGGAGDIIGIICWCIGFLIETIADMQKLRYKKIPAAQRETPWIQHGLWRYSRHPNYFGEMLLWFGIFFLGIRSFQTSTTSWSWISILSPLFTSALLLLASGLPLLEQAAWMRWKDVEAYRTYREKTSPLVPMPPSWYKNLPSGMKRFALFEWKMYERDPAGAAEQQSLEVGQSSSYDSVAITPKVRKGSITPSDA